MQSTIDQIKKLLSMDNDYDRLLEELDFLDADVEKVCVKSF